VPTHFHLALDHLDRMTDSTGLIQHAIYNVPRRDSGYTTDDNARALQLCTRLWRLYPEDRMLGRVTTYLSFLEFARALGGGFHNFMSYDRRWLDSEGCGDCQGQAVRALAEVLGSNLPADYRALAGELIESVLPSLANLRSLRAQAYVVLAWGHLSAEGIPGIEPLENVAWLAARRLLENFQHARRPEWQWFESRMTYANAVLPHAMFIAARRWPKESFLEAAQGSFDLLDRATTMDDTFWPIGSNGWFPHRESRALYDQQPVEAITMADAALAAFEALNDPKYLATFHRSHAWFHGKNSLRQPLAIVPIGSCCDGLQPTCVNRNQGAESTLSLLSTELLCYEARQRLCDHPTADGSELVPTQAERFENMES
jgi:hypothetical protein